ncbi:hypothetical protein D3C81_414970 [compost metagenome]
MRSVALKNTKDVLIKYLKAFLKNYDNYKHLCPKDYSHAEIFDKDPNVLRTFPTVIITGANGQVITGGLSDIAYEITDPETFEVIAYRYGGMYEFSINIEVGTRSTIDRELFTDLITMALRVHLRRYMEKNGVIVKDMRYGGESEFLYDSDKVYVSNIQFTTWSEWYQDVELLPLEEVTIEMEMKNKN